MYTSNFLNAKISRNDNSKIKCNIIIVVKLAWLHTEVRESGLATLSGFFFLMIVCQSLPVSSNISSKLKTNYFSASIVLSSFVTRKQDGSLTMTRTYILVHK